MIDIKPNYEIVLKKLLPFCTDNRGCTEHRDRCPSNNYSQTIQDRVVNNKQIDEKRNMQKWLTIVWFHFQNHLYTEALDSQ